MANISINKNPEVEGVIRAYPKSVQDTLRNLRRLILEAAGELEGITEMEETLKWGEPSYLVKKGSTIRIDWKPKMPGQYAMYFKCTSKLVPAFREVYPETFTYEGKRAIVFQMEDEIPEAELKHCISAALRYHRVKHLPNLGMQH